MPNPSMIDTVKSVIGLLNPSNYLEVSESKYGLRFLELFQNTDTYVIGVNYWPKWSVTDLPKNIIIFPVRPDYYWHSDYMTMEFKYRPDVVMIDGCQKVEIALRDIVFAGLMLNQNGHILITNTAPENPEEAIRPKFGDENVTKYGDTYRLLSILKTSNAATVDQILCDDGGLCVLSNINTDAINLYMVQLVRDCLDMPLENREKSFDISLEDYLKKYKSILPEVKEEKQEKQEEKISIS